MNHSPLAPFSHEENMYLKYIKIGIKKTCTYFFRIYKIKIYIYNLKNPTKYNKRDINNCLCHQKVKNYFQEIILIISASMRIICINQGKPYKGKMQRFFNKMLKIIHIKSRVSCQRELTHSLKIHQHLLLTWTKTGRTVHKRGSMESR